MKKFTIWIAPGALLIGAASLTGQAITVDLGNFDSGRIRTNSTIDGTGFSQWNGGADTPGNVGYNAGNSAYWYSAFRFAGLTGGSNPNPELFNLINGAPQVAFNLGVLWTEGTPSGVDVSLWIVPGLDIPDGQLPNFENTWLFDYPNRVQFATINADTVPKFGSSFSEYDFAAPTIEDRVDNRVLYGMTDELQGLIDAGHLTDSTPWGIVAWLDGVTPMVGDPNFATNSGTVIDLRTATLEVIPEPSTYAAIFGLVALAGVMIRRRLRK